MNINGAAAYPSDSFKLKTGLKFDHFVKTLCQKVNKNVKAFSRVANFLQSSSK